MSLSQKQTTEIVNNRTYFKHAVDLLTGKVLESTEGVDPKDYIVVSYNEKVNKRIREMFPTVLNFRGISNPEEIDANHSQVRARVNKLKAQKGRNTRRVDENEVNNVIEAVRRAHQPQYIVALMQVILWAIIYDDMFKLRKDASGTGIETKLDVDVPETYWEATVSDSEDDLLNALVGDIWRIEFPPFDRKLPLEHMLAVASSLLDEYPEISTTLGGLQRNVFAAFSYSGVGVDFDDAAFLHAELDDVLYVPVLQRNTTE